MAHAWVFWSLVSNAAIMAVEYLNRYHSSDGWLHTLQWTALPIILAQFGLYKAWSGAPHFLAAWLVFTLGNSAMRLSLVHWGTEESFAWWGTVGVALMLGGAYVVKEALHYGTAG